MQSIARLLLLVCIFFHQAAEAQCSRTGDVGAYRGPLFDAMAQIDAGMSDAVLAGLKASGVERMALFARLKGKRSGVSEVLSLKRQHPSRFVIGTPKWFDLSGDLSASFVSQTLAGLKEGSYRFVGEIMFVHGDKSHGEQTSSGERYVSANGQNVARLMAAIEDLGAPVMTHWEVYDWERDWPQFHALYAQFQRLTFIWPHGGFGSAAQVETVLSQHPNVMITLSKLEVDQRSMSSEEKAEQLGGAIVDECGIILPEWRALIDKYPTRFMFATDAHKDVRWNKYVRIVAAWRRILAQLPEPQARMLAYMNAERSYDSPR